MDEYVRRSNQMEMVDDIKVKLDDKDRRILELNYVHEEKEDAIVRLLGLSRKTVSRRLVKMSANMRTEYCASNSIQYFEKGVSCKICKRRSHKSHRKKNTRKRWSRRR